MTSTIKTLICLVLVVLPFAAVSAKKQKAQSDRAYWCEQAYKMARPVLENMAKGELQKNMQTEFSPSLTTATAKCSIWSVSAD